MDDNAHFMSVAKPLYELGDLVVFCYMIDDVLNASFAYITGVEYKPPHTHGDDWWYAVRIVGHGEKHNYDQVPQSEIIGQVIHGSQNRIRSVCAQVGCSAVGALHQSNGLGVG